MFFEHKDMINKNGVFLINEKIVAKCGNALQKDIIKEF